MGETVLADQMVARFLTLPPFRHVRNERALAALLMVAARLDAKAK